MAPTSGGRDPLSGWPELLKRSARPPATFAIRSQMSEIRSTCFDLFAKEAFHRLANECEAKADEADSSAERPEGSGGGRVHSGSRRSIARPLTV